MVALRGFCSIVEDFELHKRAIRTLSVDARHELKVLRAYEQMNAVITLCCTIPRDEFSIKRELKALWRMTRPIVRVVEVS